MKPADLTSVPGYMPARIVEADDGCWEWTGRLNHDGYGRANDDRFVHRVVYEAAVGPIPAGLTIDHLCRNRACCNPSHLEPVTLRENILRGNNPAALNARKSHCRRGHPLSGDNVRMEGNHRRCRACERIRQAEARRRQKWWGLAS